MNEALVGLISALPIVAAAFLGSALGPARLLGAGAPLLCGWVAGIGTALWALEAKWFWPLGLVTPVALGLVAAIVARRLSRRPFAAAIERLSRSVTKPSGHGPWPRALGGTLGIAGG